MIRVLIEEMSGWYLDTIQNKRLLRQTICLNEIFYRRPKNNLY